MVAKTKIRAARPLDRRAGIPTARALNLPICDMGLDAGDARQQLLDALPIAAAAVGIRAGKVVVECSNQVFKHFEKPLIYAEDDRGLILDRNGLARLVEGFLKTDAASGEFFWHDGDAISGRHFNVNLTRIHSPDARCPRCMVFLLDRTAELQTETNLRREMLSDSLTGLPNRSGFTEILEEAARHDDPHFAVLIIDLVRFSRVNECIGPMAGDELIITVARRLVHALRAGDRLARLGGDEFAILVKLVDGPGDALHVAQRVGEILAAPCRLSELEICVEASVGCAVFTSDSDDVEELVRHAQFALKRAKVTGRTEIYQPIAFRKARQRFTLETELRRAVEGGRLHMAFQPLVDLETDKVTGFEALARWKTEDGRDISPTDFIPVAEESGLIVPIGRWALDSAARTLAEWDRRTGNTLPVKMSVNLSAIQLARDDMAEVVTQAIETHGIAGNRFTLELTESAIIADPERAVRVLDSLKALDASLAMDDFGTGYSSLAYLQRLPLDILKIDRSFITGMLTDKNKIAIVRAVLSLADALGMKTTAEGIETVELSRTLAALGCAVGQGYFYSGPLDEAEAFDYMVSRNN